MSYRCNICNVVCAGQRLVYIIYRKRPFFRVDGYKTVDDFRTEIAREVQVCAGCQAELNAGLTIAQLRQRFAPVVVECNPASEVGHTHRKAKPDGRVADIFDDRRH